MKSSAKLSSNEYLILAGTLQGIIAIASQLTPKALQISAKNGPKATEPGQNISYVGGLGSSTQHAADMGSFMGPDFFNDSFPSWNKSGLKHVTMDQLSLFLYQTLTGIKFVAVSTQSTTNAMAVSIAENLLRKAYCLYADYVMKDPFYDPDMPIRCELFDSHLAELVKQL